MARPRSRRILPETIPAFEKRALWEGVADALRNAILGGTIEPGTSLVEADLAERFHLSRGPIRDALSELAREGLVIDMPRRGTVVSTLTFADLREVYSVREALETAVVRWAVEHGTRDALKELDGHIVTMERAWDAGLSYAESLGADLSFHRDLVALSQNGRIIVIYEQMLSQTRLLALTAAKARPQLSLPQRAEHRGILEALRDGDFVRAGESIHSHYESAMSRLAGGLSNSRDVATPVLS